MTGAKGCADLASPLQGWPLRNVLTHVGGLPQWLPLPGFSSAPGQAGRNAERIETMRRTVEAQRDQLEPASRRPRDQGELAIDSAAAFSARKVLQALLNVDIDDPGSVEAFHNRRRRDADLH